MSNRCEAAAQGVVVAGLEGSESRLVSGPMRPLLISLFFLSGFAALVYQVAWQRMLVVFAGGDVAAIALIVAVFMLGLGTGGIAGGVVADRSPPGRNVLYFALAEMLVAVCGMASKPLIHDFLYLRVTARADAASWAPALAGFLSLLPPTFLMGASLPLLAKGLMRDLDDAAATIGRLYGINTLGAAAGALTTVWMLLPLGGVTGALWTAAAFNAAAALLALPFAAIKPKSLAGNAPTSPDHPLPVPRERGAFAGCMAAFALSGFLAIALELVWFRLLGVMLKSTAFTLGTLLGIFLGALGAGSLFGTWFAEGSRSPGRRFLWLQSAAAIYAAAIAGCAAMAVHEWELLRSLKEYLGSYEPVDANTAVAAAVRWIAGAKGGAEPWMAGVFFSLHFVLPALVLGPPAFLMGASFPLLQKAAHDDMGRAGRRIGMLQAANIAGCVAGSLAASFVLFPVAGIAGALRLVAFMGVGFGVAAIVSLARDRPGSRAWMPPALGLSGAALIAIWSIPGQKTLWARAHGAEAESVIVEEDAAGVTLLKKPLPGGKHGRTEVFVNGIGQSWLPYEGVHSLLGAIPALLHPNPEKIAIIGLGSGDTLYCAASRPETREITCVEIIGAQEIALRRFAEDAGYAALRSLLADERVRIVQGDGRRFLMSSPQAFDIIEADALRPASAYSGYLYSEEYFRLVSSRLRPGGFAVTWKPTRRVEDTFCLVFPHVLDLGPILIGSHAPVDTDRSKIELRLADFEIRHHYRAAGIEITAQLMPLLRSGLARFVRDGPSSSAGRDINTDLHPKDEFALPALWGR